MENQNHNNVTWGKTWRPYYLVISLFIVGVLLFLLVINFMTLGNPSNLNREINNYDIDYLIKNPLVKDTIYSFVEFNENSYNCEEVFCSGFIKQTNKTTFNQTTGQVCKNEFSICYNPNIKVSYPVILNDNTVILEHIWSKKCGSNYKCVIDFTNRYMEEGPNEPVNGVYQIKDIYNLTPKREYNPEPYDERFIELINDIITTNKKMFVIMLICIGIIFSILFTICTIACILPDEQIRRENRERLEQRHCEQLEQV